MILVDTSVLIDYFRTKDAELLSLMIRVRASVCGIVRAEILAGARDIQNRDELHDALDAHREAAFPEILWDRAGDNSAKLRRNGLTIPLSDVAVATLAMFLDVELWARDKHYPAIQKVFPQLKLFQEPP